MFRATWQHASLKVNIGDAVGFLTRGGKYHRTAEPSSSHPWWGMVKAALTTLTFPSLKVTANANGLVIYHDMF